MSSLNSNQYLKFNAARVRPAVDLMNRAAVHVDDKNAVHSVLDLGCGAGNVADLLCRTFPNAHVAGVDRCNEMIIQALRDNAGSELKERMSFRVGTAETESTAHAPKHDIVYCNSSLQMYTNHEVLLPNIIHNLIKPNGVLAIQLPDTRLQASHVLMVRAAEHCGVYEKINNVRIARAEETPEWYFNLLRPLVTEIDIWTTEYVEQLTTPQLPASPPSAYTINNIKAIYEVPAPGSGASTRTAEAEKEVDCMETDATADTTLRHPVYDYVRTTALAPILEALGGEDSVYGVQYVQEYNRLLYEAYPIVKVDNKITSFEEYLTLVPFRRLFIVCKL